MPATAFQHIQEDISRTRAIINHADPMPQTNASEILLRSDMLRSAWMFAIGALDAYFCDAYTDLVAATIISKDRHPAMNLPEFFLDIKVPVRTVLEDYAVNANWRWRMAARRMMDRENVLSLEEIRSLFNKFFREDHKLFGDVLEDWILHPDAKKRVFGVTRSAYNAMTPAEKNTARKEAKRQMYERFGDLIQRRHDCIHNCDRPKMAPQALTLGGTVLKVVQDVEFLVNLCNEHINSEFREFLNATGCPGAIIIQAGY